MSRVLSFLVAAGFVLLPLTTFAVDRVVLTAKNGNVTFSHSTHSANLSCVICHGSGQPERIELSKEGSHTICIACHKETGAGPVKCNDCHKK